ncbi:MAG: hypothetical protein ACXVAY_08915 [Mucilaginibacter sp.]
MNLFTFLYKYRLLIACLLLFCQSAIAQTDNDAIMIPKNYFCGGVMYSSNKWTNYWEGTFKRDNGNIGTLSTNMYTAMVNYGITGDLNILASVPYVTTNASAGTLAGQKGLQDMVLSAKWIPFKQALGNGMLKLFTIASVSIPLSNYEPNFLPMSIGMHSQSAMLRILADYHTGKFFVSGSGQYIRRTNITIDQNAYYTTQMYYTNQVAMPDGSSFNFRTGYRSPKLIAEVVLENNTTLGGFDIRKNDMPFPSNRMNDTMAGVNFKYSFSTIAGLELTAGADYVIDGRNVGQSTIFHGGAYYLFDLSKITKR